MTSIKIIPFLLVSSLALPCFGCFKAKADSKPVATVTVVDSEIEIIDSNTVNQ